MPVRALIVLLLILNLGVALWWSTRPPAPTAPAVTLPAGAEPLRLLDEPAAAPARAPAPQVAPSPVPAIAPPPAPAPTSAPAPAPTDQTTAAAPVDAAPATCRSFGPFQDAAGAAQAQARLAPLVQALATRTVQPDARGWQVLLRAMPDRDAAAATVERLIAAGFRDHYLMPTAADGTVDIALGRFGSEPAARRHQQALAAAGFGAVAEPLGGPGAARYWIDVAPGAQAELADLQRASGATRSEPVDCAALAAR
ncbi:SPOR domain-containing protein [uncultured Luteimonas sp.]|uniref:SPOR domain-containing protein n=1 Tax=uncultured Luteimonas sp. TaxID=453144 RepID=UPI00261E74AE|nr:SPOR domain-containing protein [uncultured Luteimonas sp.]